MPYQITVTERLRERLLTISPVHLEIIDDSSRHAGHAGAKGLPPLETHFIIHITLPESTPRLSRVAIHQKVYAAIGDLMNNPIHAVNIIVTPK